MSCRIGLCLIFLLACLLGGCATPTNFDNKLTEPLAPLYSQRILVLIFERENFQPLASHTVNIKVKPPSELISPSEALTDESGRLTVVIRPGANYDQNALKDGDVVVDFPTQMVVSMNTAHGDWEWEFVDHDSFARYRDPLYQGLNRNPATEPVFLTLTTP